MVLTLRIVHPSCRILLPTIFPSPGLLASYSNIPHSLILTLFHSHSLSLSLSVCLSLFMFLCISLTLALSLFLYLCKSLSVYVSPSLTISLPLPLFVSHSIYCIFLCLSLSLSIPLSVVSHFSSLVFSLAVSIYRSPQSFASTLSPGGICTGSVWNYMSH